MEIYFLKIFSQALVLLISLAAVSILEAVVFNHAIFADLESLILPSFLFLLFPCFYASACDASWLAFGIYLQSSFAFLACCRFRSAFFETSFFESSFFRDYGWGFVLSGFLPEILKSIPIIRESGNFSRMWVAGFFSSAAFSAGEPAILIFSEYLFSAAAILVFSARAPKFGSLISAVSVSVILRSVLVSLPEKFHVAWLSAVGLSVAGGFALAYATRPKSTDLLKRGVSI